LLGGIGTNSLASPPREQDVGNSMMPLPRVRRSSVSATALERIGREEPVLAVAQRIVLVDPPRARHQALSDITKHGVEAFAGADYRSAMPAFGGVLSDGDIIAVLSRSRAAGRRRSASAMTA
jgi:hypothetical protein